MCKFPEKLPEYVKCPREIREVLSLWNAIRWQWIGKLVQLRGRTKLWGAQEKSTGGVLFACLGVFICPFAFHISTINSNHSNQTLNRPALIGASRHVPAQRTPAFFFLHCFLFKWSAGRFSICLPCSSCWVIPPEGTVRGLPLLVW